ncbi:MAG: hypothetical protein LH630_08495 [Actinomycetia bacterium]|nr:hypothetical protein [Actinomycetes bacterium]
MGASRRLTAVLSAAAIGSTVLLTAVPNASAGGIGVTVTPAPPKEAIVGWDASSLGSIDYVMVGVKTAASSPDDYLFKMVGDADGDVEADLPSSSRLSDLNVATSYNFQVTVHPVSGSPVTETIRAQGYRLTLKTERDVVRRGGSVKVQGTLQSSGPAGTPVSDGNVKIQANGYPFDDNNWSTVDTSNTLNDGSYSGSVTPEFSTRYRAIYTGDGIGSWTASEFVGVRVKVTIVANPNPVDFGRVAEFRGSFRAPDDKVQGAPVMLQRKISGAWTSVAQGEVNANGNYSLSFESLNRNDSYYRVTGSGGEYFADSTSRKIKLVVR